MNIKQRVENLERAIPVNLPPCTPEVAGRIYGLYLKKTGTDPSSFHGELEFMFPCYEKTRGPEEFDPLEPEEETFYQENVSRAIEYWKGTIQGLW
ncbi:MAG: hypothetical protein V1799_09690 [bacterium]